MGTTLHPEVACSTVPPRAHGAFLALLDLAFGRGPGRELRKDLPVALGKANRAHHYAGWVGDRLACGAAAVVRDWIGSRGTVRVAAMGCFATHPDHRGKGLSRELQAHMLAELRAGGAELAVLWAAEPELYRGRGFEPCGQELHLDLSGLGPTSAAGGQVREASAMDEAALLRLHRGHAWRVEREPGDIAAHLQPGTSRAWCLQRDGQLVAYAALGKGCDFPGYVHDFAGRPADVHHLWAHAARQGANMVLLPDGGQPYLEGAAAGLARRAQPAMMAVELVAGAAGPGGVAALRLAAFGFDSA